MILLRPWSEEDRPLLVRNNTPRQTEHLGGPESDEQLRQRHRRYLSSAAPGRTRMFSIQSDDVAAGTIGYWEREWRGCQVYETGWSIFPEFQGRGIASEATRALIETLQAEAIHRFLHAFPSPDNAPSNGICRRLGFVFQGECDFEYPPGRVMRSNDWRFDLKGRGAAPL
jgi:RimJ/RimL family protein N-acetyltransferase